jgi:hypothetical protein
MMRAVRAWNNSQLNTKPARATAVARKRPEIVETQNLASHAGVTNVYYPWDRFEFTGIDWRNTAEARKRPANVAISGLMKHSAGEL